MTVFAFYMPTSEHNIDNASASAAQKPGLSPEAPGDFYALGNAFKDQGDLDQAIRCYHKAIELNPDLAEACNNLGNAYKLKAQLNNAFIYYQKACRLNPRYAQAYYNLGILYQETGRFKEALASYHNAVSLSPQFVEAHFNLGNTFRELGKLDDAIRCYYRALEVNPDYAEAYNGLGTVYQEQGKLDEAYSCYQKHMHIKTDAGIAVKASLLLPVICDSTRSILTYREVFAKNIEKLSHQRIRLQDPSKQIGKTSFYLAYHGLNNRQLQKKIARFYLDACPDLGWQPACEPAFDRSNGKIKVGVISRYLRGHTIGYLNYGLIKHLDREKFHVTVFGFPGIMDNLSRIIVDAADQTVMLPAQLSVAREIIAQQALDILLYLDILSEVFLQQIKIHPKI